MGRRGPVRGGLPTRWRRPRRDRATPTGRGRPGPLPGLRPALARAPNEVTSGLRPGRDENDLAQLPALSEVLVRFVGPVHGKGRLQQHAHPPCLEERHDVAFHRPGHDGLFDRCPGPQCGATDAKSALHDGEKVDLGCVTPPPTPMTAMRPVTAMAPSTPAMLGAPTSSRTTSKGPRPSASSGSAATAPRVATASRSCA